MRPSVARLVITTVALAAALAFAILVAFVLTADWTEEDARRIGVTWVFREIETASPEERPQRLAELQPDLGFPVALLDAEALRVRLGRQPAPGALVLDRTGTREQWAFMAFEGGAGGLAAGPIDPINPTQQVPIGLVLGVILLPLIAVLVATRLTRQLEKVQQASESLGAGVLTARVDNPSGPSSELAESFNRMAERIEQLVRERDELLQAVSHELGSPLARLRVQLELLADEGPTQGDGRTRIDAMAQQLDEIEELVEDLSRWVQSDEAAVRPESFDLLPPLSDLVELARYDESADPEIDIELVIPAQAVLSADPRLFQRVMDNLLRNAMRYAEDRVRVVVRAADDAWTIAVEDDGPGIPADERARVLEPFTRLGTDRDRGAGGVGLGLAIVQRILKGHGGSVVIEQSELGGALVRTVWPRKVRPE